MKIFGIKYHQRESGNSAEEFTKKIAQADSNYEKEVLSHE